MSEYKRECYGGLPLYTNDASLNTSSRNFEFRYTCPDQLDRAILKFHEQRAVDLTTAQTLKPSNVMPKFCKIKHGGHDVTGMYKSHDQDVETVISRQLHSVNVRALTTDEVQRLIEQSNVNENKQKNDKPIETTAAAAAAAAVVNENKDICAVVASAETKADDDDQDFIIELSQIEAMHREVCEELKRVKSSNVDLAEQTGNDDKSTNTIASPSGATHGSINSSNNLSATSLFPNREYMTVSYEDYPQLQAKWVEVVHSAELSQKINVELCKPMDASLMYAASDSVAYEFMTAHADYYQSGDNVVNIDDYDDGNTENGRAAQGEYYVDDSDLEYEMAARPKYAKYCQSKPERFNEGDDGDSDMPLFVEMEKMPVMNLSFLKNTAPMRYSEMTEKLSDDDARQLKYSKNRSDVYDQIRVVEPMQALGGKKSNKKRVLQPKKKEQYPVHSTITMETLTEQTVARKAVAKQTTTDSAPTERGGIKGTQKKTQRSLKHKVVSNASNKAYSNNKSTVNSQVAPAPAPSPATQSNKKLTSRQKQNAARHVTQQSLNSSRGEVAPSKSNNSKVDAQGSQSARTKALQTTRQSAGKETTRKPKAVKMLVCTKSIEDLKMEKLSIYNKMALTQERIIQALDRLRCSLLQIQIPDCNYEKSKRQRNAFEFCVRFSRNFLYPLKGMIDDFRFMSPDAFHSAVSNDACYRVSAIYSLIYQSLHTYQRQLRYFLLDQVPQKLGALIEMIYTMTTICLEKGLFDRQDTIIECMQERCSKFLVFIEDMQEERFVQERENVRRQAEKQNKLNQSHSHYDLKMCMNDMNMYEPKLVRKCQPPRPKRIVRKLRKTSAQQQSAQAQPIQESEPDSVLPPEDVKTHIEDFNDDCSQCTLPSHRCCLRERHGLQQSMTSYLNDNNNGYELPTTSFAATAAAAAVAAQHNYRIECAKNEDSEDSLNPLNAALIEALQMVTKQQVRQVLEPIIQSLGSMLDKKNSKTLLHRILTNLNEQQAQLVETVDETQNSKPFQNVNVNQTTCISAPLETFITKDKFNNKKQQTLNESAKPTTTVASCELKQQRNSQGASKALRSTTETKTLNQPAKRAKKKSNTAFAETALNTQAAASTAQLTSTRIETTQDKKSRSMVEASTAAAAAAAAAAEAAAADRKARKQKLKASGYGNKLIKTNSIKAVTFSRDLHDRYDAATAIDNIVNVVPDCRNSNHKVADSAKNAKPNMQEAVYLIQAAAEKHERNNQKLPKNSGNCSNKTKRSNIKKNNLRDSLNFYRSSSKTSILSLELISNDDGSSSSNHSKNRMSVGNYLKPNKSASGADSYFWQRDQMRSSDCHSGKRTLAMLEQSLRESKYEIPTIQRPSYSTIYGASNTRPLKKYTSVASVYSRQNMLEQSRKLQQQCEEYRHEQQNKERQRTKAKMRQPKQQTATVTKCVHSTAQPTIKPRTNKSAAMRLKQARDSKAAQSLDQKSSRFALVMTDSAVVSATDSTRKNTKKYYAQPNDNISKIKRVESGISIYHHSCLHANESHEILNRPTSRWTKPSNVTSAKTMERRMTNDSGNNYEWSDSGIAFGSVAAANKSVAINRVNRRTTFAGGDVLRELTMPDVGERNRSDCKNNDYRTEVWATNYNNCEIPLTRACNTMPVDHLAILTAALNKFKSGNDANEMRKECGGGGGDGDDGTTIAKLLNSSRLQLLPETSPYNDFTLIEKYKKLQQQQQQQQNSNRRRNIAKYNRMEKEQLLLEQLKQKIFQNEQDIQQQQNLRQTQIEMEERLKVNKALNQLQDEEEEEEEEEEELQPNSDKQLQQQNRSNKLQNNVKKVQTQKQQYLTNNASTNNQHWQQQRQQQRQQFLQQHQQESVNNSKRKAHVRFVGIVEESEESASDSQTSVGSLVKQQQEESVQQFKEQELKNPEQPQMPQNLLQHQQQQQQKHHANNARLKGQTVDNNNNNKTNSEHQASHVKDAENANVGETKTKFSKDDNEVETTRVENLRGLLEQRKHFSQTCESSYFYNNPIYPDPWKVFAGFADNLTAEIAETVENDFTNGVSRFVEDFLEAETQM